MLHRINTFTKNFNALTKECTSAKHYQLTNKNQKDNFNKIIIIVKLLVKLLITWKSKTKKIKIQIYPALQMKILKKMKKIIFKKNRKYKKVTKMMIMIMINKQN